MNKNLLHQQSTAKTGPRLINCTLCHDWSGVNGASMIRVDSNCRTYIIYIHYTDSGWEDTSGQNITHSARKSSSWYLLWVMKQVHPWSSKFIRTLGTPVTYKSRFSRNSDDTGIIEATVGQIHWDSDLDDTHHWDSRVIIEGSGHVSIPGPNQKNHRIRRKILCCYCCIWIGWKSVL